MSDEKVSDYGSKLKLYGMYAGALFAILVINALLSRYVGQGQQLPPPPPPVIVVSPESPMVVSAVQPKDGAIIRIDGKGKVSVP